MADGSPIEWTDATWNPVVGCSIVSPGCTNCYAMKLAGTRLKHTPSRIGLTIDTKAGPVWNNKVRLIDGWVDQPSRWRRPRRIFVCAHGDLFAEQVPEEWIHRVWRVMISERRHTFQVLTKRPARMREYVASFKPDGDGWVTPGGKSAYQAPVCGSENQWPPPNIWLGTSVEDQARADERIPDLLTTPAAVRFLSVEPLLGPVDLSRWTTDPAEYLRYCDAVGGPQPTVSMLNWVIVGGESGPGARPMELAWAHSIVKQCGTAGVACFVKQMGSNAISTGAAGADADGIYRYRWRDRKGGDWSEWPADLCVREFPQVRSD